MIYRILKRPVFTAEFNLRKKSKMTSEELLELLKQIQLDQNIFYLFNFRSEYRSDYYSV